MKIVIEIPKEFESHFEFDRFADSLARVASDIEALGFKMSGRYERETITMIRKAFENATPLPKGHGRIGDFDIAEEWLEDGYMLDDVPALLEADKEQGEEEKKQPCGKCIHFNRCWEEREFMYIETDKDGKCPRYKEGAEE